MGVTETVVESPTAPANGNRPPSSTDEILLSDSTTSPPYQLPTGYPIFVDETSSFSGSGSGAGSGSGIESDESNKFEGDVANLEDDEDFDNLGAAGSVHLDSRRRRSLKLASFQQRERHWYVDRRRDQGDRFKWDLIVKEDSKTSMREKADVTPSQRVPEQDVEPYYRDGGPVPEFPVSEYHDRDDNRADMLKFER